MKDKYYCFCNAFILLLCYFLSINHHPRVKRKHCASSGFVRIPVWTHDLVQRSMRQCECAECVSGLSGEDNETFLGITILLCAL